MLIDALHNNSINRLHQTALEQGDRTLSYDAMWRLVDDYANTLSHMGLQQGQVIGVMGQNGIDLAVLILSLWHIGATPFPLPITSEQCLLHLVKQRTIPQNILVHRTLMPIISKQGMLTPLSVTSCSTTQEIPFTHCALIQPRLNDILSVSSETALLITSSGTTNSPKVIKLTKSGILSNIVSNTKSLDLSGNDVSLQCLPLNYSYGLIGQFLSHLFAGACVVFPVTPGLIGSIPKIIAQSAVTTLFTVPVLLRALLIPLSQGITSVGSYFATLRLLTIGGGPIDGAYLELALKVFGRTSVAITYGLSEAGPRVTTLWVNQQWEHRNSVGQPIEGVTVKVLDEDGNDQGPEQEGNVVVFSRSVMEGYITNSDAKAFIPETMIYTGDRGFLTKDGFLYVFGRKGDIVYINEKHIFYNEIIAKFYSHPCVLDVTVCKKSNNVMDGRTEIKVRIVGKPGAKICVEELYLLCDEINPLLREKISIEVHRHLPSLAFRK